MNGQASVKVPHLHLPKSDSKAKKDLGLSSCSPFSRGYGLGRHDTGGLGRDLDTYSQPAVNQAGGLSGANKYRSLPHTSVSRPAVCCHSR